MQTTVFILNFIMAYSMTAFEEKATEISINYVALKKTTFEIKNAIEPNEKEYCSDLIRGMDDFLDKQLSYVKIDNYKMDHFIKESFLNARKCTTRVDLRLPVVEKLIKETLSLQIKSMFDSENMFSGIKSKFEQFVDDAMSSVYEEVAQIMKNYSILGADVLLYEYRKNISRSSDEDKKMFLSKIQTLFHEYVNEVDKYTVYSDEDRFTKWILKQFSTGIKAAVIEFYKDFYSDLVHADEILNNIFSRVQDLNTYFFDPEASQTRTELWYIEKLSNDIRIKFEKYNLLEQRDCVFTEKDDSLKNIFANMESFLKKITSIKKEIKKLIDLASQKVLEKHGDALKRLNAYLETLESPFFLQQSFCNKNKLY